MVFLLGKRIRSLSIKHPLGNRSDTEVLDAEKLRALKARLIADDKEAADELVKAHIKLGIHIAGQYAAATGSSPEDLISEAMLAIAMSIKAIKEDKIPDEHITTYIAGRIHARCSRYFKLDKVYRIPTSTVARRRKEGKPIVTPTRHDLQYSQPGTKAPKDKQWVFMHPAMCVPPETQRVDVEDILKQATKTKRQKDVMALLIEGNTIREIAKTLGLSKSVVSRDVETVRDEVHRLL